MRIAIEQLNMTYPTGKQALRDVDLTLESPNLIGLLGPNGAGKSTLMKLLVAGLLPSSGTISVDGTPLQACEKGAEGASGLPPSILWAVRRTDGLAVSRLYGGIEGNPGQPRCHR